MRDRRSSSVQELRHESRGGRAGLSVLTNLLVSVDVKLIIEPCFGTGLSLSLICQLTSEDIKQHYLPTEEEDESGLCPGRKAVTVQRHYREGVGPAVTLD